MGEKPEKEEWWRWALLFLALVAAVVGVLWQQFSLVSKKNRKSEGLVMATSLVSAVENFYGEYNELPDVGASAFDTASPEGVRLLEMLLALEGAGPDAQNIRSVIFLQGKEAKGKKGGIDYGDGDSVLGIYDPTGRPYQVVLNTGKNDSLEFKFGDQQVKLRGKQVAVSSFGPDGKPNTPDDIKSWN